MVPGSAVQTIEGQTVVFVPKTGDSNTFMKRPIIIGPEVAGMVPVRSGLKDGETVVTYGSFILKAELLKNQTSDQD